jgi:hypothetical protein
LEEIKKKMLNHGTGVRNGLDKPKKADWAAALGRAEAIKALLRFCISPVKLPPLAAQSEN